MIASQPGKCVFDIQVRPVVDVAELPVGQNNLSPWRVEPLNAPFLLRFVREGQPPVANERDPTFLRTLTVNIVGRVPGIEKDKVRVNLKTLLQHFDVVESQQALVPD